MENETLIRLGAFAGLFLLLAAAEALLPRRPRSQPRARRWLTNWALVLLSSLMLRLLGVAIPLLATGAALDAAARGWGLFNALAWPAALEILLCVLALDLLIWAQHLVAHKIPLLWRIHRVHHADRDIDVATAIRFHPFEIAVSMVLKVSAVYALGAPAVAVIFFEILLNGMAMFNHANLALPPQFDAALCRVIVTPDMHRVHHSIHRDEHDSNYGFSLSLWDRLFGTYRASPRGGQLGMEIGLGQWQDTHPNRLGWSLLVPFRKP
ncbi:sterol desaturase family protein [Rhodobacteraceae bacterium DSL-40]|uniref:sterol desaturase family protein n=1 Tax=Amaricoccus sp. B4 TaxID=3368557 RepID=UPI000DACFA8F